MTDRDPVQCPHPACRADSVDKCRMPSEMGCSHPDALKTLGGEGWLARELAAQSESIRQAVERGIDAWIATASLPVFSRRSTVEAVLSAALAPYGGLDAIRKLEPPA